MRRISLHMFITFDGYAYFPKYPGYDDSSSPEIDDAMWLNHFSSIDTVILGSKSYRDWAKFWPPSNRKESDSPFLHAFSKFIDSINKIVISNNLETTEWKPTRIMNGDLTEIVSQLHKEPGKNIAIGGGASIAQQFINLGLVDDYYLTVFPVILGNSKKDVNWLFNNIQHQQTLLLRDVIHTKNGECVFHYETLKNYIS